MGTRGVASSQTRREETLMARGQQSRWNTYGGCGVEQGCLERKAPSDPTFRRGHLSDHAPSWPGDRDLRKRRDAESPTPLRTFLFRNRCARP